MLLLALVALASAAITAPTAFAQSNPENHETLDVTREPSGDHCPAITKPTQHTTAGGCLIHVASSGEYEIRKHVFGIESHITKCNLEFWIRFNEDAEGYIIHQVMTGPSCPREPCREAGQPERTPWPAHGDELHKSTVPKAGETGLTSSIAGHREILTTNRCISTLDMSTNESCEIDIPFNQTATTHEYEFGDAVAEMPSHGITGFRCEIVGHWRAEHAIGRLENIGTAELETKVEITHVAVENKAETP